MSHSGLTPCWRCPRSLQGFHVRFNLTKSLNVVALFCSLGMGKNSGSDKAMPKMTSQMHPCPKSSAQLPLFAGETSQLLALTPFFCFSKASFSFYPFFSTCVASTPHFSLPALGWWVVLVLLRRRASCKSWSSTIPPPRSWRITGCIPAIV